MDKQLAEKWVADLRTNPPKTIGWLYSMDGGYCCLGRLCKVLGLKDKTLRGNCSLADVDIFLDLPPLQSSIGSLPNKEKIIINGVEYDCLADANDSGNVSFAQIADFIEQNWERL